jgi:hypothetical protein
VRKSQLPVYDFKIDITGMYSDPGRQPEEVSGEAVRTGVGRRLRGWQNHSLQVPYLFCYLTSAALEKKSVVNLPMQPWRKN